MEIRTDGHTFIIIDYLRYKKRSDEQTLNANSYIFETILWSFYTMAKLIHNLAVLEREIFFT